MTHAVITLPELLSDKVYREFFTTRPAMPVNLHPSIFPWRVYVRQTSDGPWRKRDFHTYIEAFKFLKPRLTAVYDASLTSRGIAFDPPARVVRITRGGKPVIDPETKKPQLRRIVWLPVLPMGEVAHRWCPYCRRPTVFTWFSKHHAFPKGFVFDGSLQRCSICGSSERLVDNRG